MDRVLLVFYAASLMLGIVGGAYYVVSRNAVYIEVGPDYAFMSLLVASETLPGFFSVVGGVLGDMLGRRRMIVLGALSSIPFIIAGMGGVRSLPYLILMYGVLTSMASPNVYGGLLHYTGSSGSSYSLIAVAGSIGWAIGGVIGGYMAESLSFTACMTVLAAMVSASYLAVYAAYPGKVTYPGASLMEVVDGAGRVWPLFLASVLSFTGVRFFFSNYVLALRSMLTDPVVYGLVVNTIPAITGAAIWPIIGRVSDNRNPVLLAMIAVAEYAVLIAVFLNLGDPVVVSVLWAIPIYPLLEQGLVISISRKLPGRLQSLASGVFTTSLSVAGFAILLLGRVLADINAIGWYSISILAASLSLMLAGRLMGRL
ncbi:hypothetical protein Desmu_0635 [Desulfurococcus mucosus DSM 2162]|uniref:Major facilitator superfamily MFS_1 n=1 Tax=Desulfurococcus mucosus (strain ATCC 35584 / DSM 2162 / JCM 9187 / O7/1) TaxID=765177 RepID=E8R8W7_DESM0|nr:hypothetical protein Desmu_0635 [Desulfurococcus mucosus DSM 2162]